VAAFLLADLDFFTVSFTRSTSLAQWLNDQ
jgi:hypothetical protein